MFRIRLFIICWFRFIIGISLELRLDLLFSRWGLFGWFYLDNLRCFTRFAIETVTAFLELLHACLEHLIEGVSLKSLASCLRCILLDFRTSILNFVKVGLLLSFYWPELVASKRTFIVLFSVELFYRLIVSLEDLI